MMALVDLAHQVTVDELARDGVHQAEHSHIFANKTDEDTAAAMPPLASPLHLHQAMGPLADPMQLPTELVDKIFAFLTTKELS
jgi:hypothetical protein